MYTVVILEILTNRTCSLVLMSTCRQINTEIENKQKMTNWARLSSHVNILAYITETADAWPNLSGMDSFVIHPKLSFSETKVFKVYASAYTKRIINKLY